MIVISQALSLAEADQDLPLNFPVIGWHNLVTVDTVTTDTEEEDFPASNLANTSTNLKWRGVSGSPGEEYITVDVSGYMDETDYVGIVGHNFGSAGIGVEVGYFDEGESPPEWVQLVNEVMPADDGPLIFRYLPQSLSEVVIKLSPGSAPPEMAVLYVGKLLVMERGVQEFTPLRFGRDRDIITGTSEAGDFLGRIQVGGRSVSNVSFIGLSSEWVRQYLDDFLEDSATHPFFFAWNPQEYPHDTGFAWLRTDPQPLFHLPGHVSVAFEMTGVLR